MSIYWSYILFIVGFFDIALGLVVASRDPRKLLNIAFMTLSVSLGFWVLGIAVFGVTTSNEVAFWAAKVYYAAPLIVSLSLIYMAYLFPKGSSLSRKNIFIPLIPVATLVILLLCVPHFITVRVEDMETGKRVIVDQLQYLLYAVVVSSSIMFALATIFRRIPTLTGIYRKQAVWLFAMLLVVSPLGLWYNLVLPHWLNDYSLIWVGPLATTIYVVSNVISIVRHRMFDIKLAAVRSLAYVLVLLSLAVAYYCMAYVVSVTLFKSETTTAVSISPVNILLALVLAFMFQPIKRFFDHLTDNIFYRDMYKSDEFFARISELLGSTTDLRGLLERSSTEIASTLKAEQTFFFLYYSNGTRHHMSAGTAHHAKLPLYDAHELDAFIVSGTKGIIITDALPDESNVRRMLVSHRIALVMPLRYAGKLIGYVLLGEQQRSGGYTKRDLKVLNTVADEFVIAIQNALSVHAVKEINAHLQQRIDVATKELRSSNSQLRHLDEVKDEFMSMASHQLRTPLTSIKGYLSMVLEEDMGKITPQQRTVLNEAFNSSERMVRLIADFLNVSRLQTGKFIVERSPADIVSVVRSEVESLKMIAKTHDMKLTYHAKDDKFIIPVDEAKLRQVIMNFIDNAIYYSRANSTIDVSLEQIGNEIAFKVVDTGIGVPKDEQDMLFNKFFRAKNARQQRPDGTGVGLYLAKKVVTAHGGKMIFSSVEGQGSTFGFRIPLPKLQTSSQSDNLKDQHNDNS